METFIRKSFYIDPPNKEADTKEWQAWLTADTKKAIQAKRAYTQSLQAGDLPDGMQASVTRKINGVWKSVVAIGFAGAEDNTTMEPAVEATQETDLIHSRFVSPVRGIHKRKSGAAQRKARKDRNHAAAMMRIKARHEQ